MGRFETRWSREDGQYERICGWVCLLFGGYADEIRSYEDSSVFRKHPLFRSQFSCPGEPLIQSNSKEMSTSPELAIYPGGTELGNVRKPDA